jgi:hypothetical protein
MEPNASTWQSQPFETDEAAANTPRAKGDIDCVLAREMSGSADWATPKSVLGSDSFVEPAQRPGGRLSVEG